MQYKYSLRFVLMPNVNVDKRIAELIDFCKNALIDDVIFFIAAEDFHVGHPTKELAKTYVDVILKAKAELDKIGVTTSLNPWCTLVHGDRGRTLTKGQSFRNMVFGRGEVAQTVVCPLCEEWRAYYVDYLTYLINEIHPKTVWLEDDFRLHGHTPTDTYGCFCAEHLRLYAQELGVKEISREDFYQGLLDGKTGYREAYARVSKESMEDALDYIVEGVGKLGSELSLMTGSGVAYHFEGRDFRELFRILSRYETPQQRLGLTGYRQTESHIYAKGFTKEVFPTRAFVEDDLIIYSEVENAPMSRYVKSARWTAYQMLVSSPLLLNGATLDIFEFNGNGITDGEYFAENLREIKPFLSKILTLGLRYNRDNCGVNVPILKNRYLGYGAVDRLESLDGNDNYMGGVLSMLGGSVKYSEAVVNADTVALLPTTARLMSDEEIAALFATKKLVILNADVVELLIERGLGALIGISRYEKLIERIGLYTYEQAASSALGVDADARASCQLFVGNYLKAEYTDSDIEALTKVYNYDYSFVGEGITRVKNALIFPYYDSCSMPYGLYHELRGAALRYAVMQTGSKQVFFSHNCMAIPFYFKKEGADYAIFVNYIEDEAKNLTFSANELYTKIEVATVANPEFERVDFVRLGCAYRLDFTMASNSAIIVKLIK